MSTQEAEFLGTKTDAAVSTAVLAGQADKIFRQAVQYVFGAGRIFDKKPILDTIRIMDAEFLAFVAEIHPHLACYPI